MLAKSGRSLIRTGLQTQRACIVAKHRSQVPQPNIPIAETLRGCCAKARSDCTNSHTLTPTCVSLVPFKAFITPRGAHLDLLALPSLFAVPYMPGGSKFMRNPPPPLEAVFPDGIPPEVNVVSQTIEGVQLPKSAWKDGHEHVLVDPYQKKAL